jgi:DNA-binding MarR family transcriptional regulator
MHSQANSLNSPCGERPADWGRFAQLTGACSRLLRRALGERLSQSSLTETEFLLFSACAEAEAASQGAAQIDLAKATGLSPAQISGVMERLREQGWIAPERKRDDRRRQHWRLTAEGRKVLTAACSALADLGPHLAGRLSVAERAMLEKLLCLLAQAAADAEAAPSLRWAPERRAA